LLTKAGRTLVPTEVGRLVYGYADEIFGLGRDLVEALEHRPTRRPLRVVVGIDDVVPKEIAHRLMVGIVLSGNLVQLVVFWELTSFTSFMLIAYWYHRAEARRGASMALTVTATGGLCLLAAVICWDISRAVTSWTACSPRVS
jgi:hypothetical protein